MSAPNKAAEEDGEEDRGEDEIVFQCAVCGVLSAASAAVLAAGEESLAVGGDGGVGGEAVTAVSAEDMIPGRCTVCHAVLLVCPSCYEKDSSGSRQGEECCSTEDGRRTVEEGDHCNKSGEAGWLQGRDPPSGFTPSKDQGAAVQTVGGTGCCPPGEFHCSRHAHLSRLYFTDLSRFSRRELLDQAEGLRTLWAGIKEGREHRRKRATLRKQIDKIELRISQLMEPAHPGAKQNQ